jgi:hypothetical protein
MTQFQPTKVRTLSAEGYDSLIIKRRVEVREFQSFQLRTEFHKELSPAIIRHKISSIKLQMLDLELTIHDVLQYFVFHLACKAQIDMYKMRHEGEDLLKIIRFKF